MGRYDEMGYAFGRKTQTIQDMVDINNEEYRKEREERVKEANPTYSNGDPDRRE